jgi:hypothetical protein
VLGKEVQTTTNEDVHVEYEARDWEAVMLIKLSMINNILPERKDGDDVFKMWVRLKNMHETSNKGIFFLSWDEVFLFDKLVHNA